MCIYNINTLSHLILENNSLGYIRVLILKIIDFLSNNNKSFVNMAEETYAFGKKLIDSVYRIVFNY